MFRVLELGLCHRRHCRQAAGLERGTRPGSPRGPASTARQMEKGDTRPLNSTCCWLGPPPSRWHTLGRGGPLVGGHKAFAEEDRKRGGRCGGEGFQEKGAPDPGVNRSGQDGPAAGAWTGPCCAAPLIPQMSQSTRSPAVLGENADSWAPPHSESLGGGPGMCVQTRADGCAVAVQGRLAKSSGCVSAFPQGTRATGGRKTGTKRLSFYVEGWGVGRSREGDLPEQRRGRGQGGRQCCCGLRVRGLGGSTRSWAPRLRRP